MSETPSSYPAQRRKGGDGDSEDWLITYSDAITLILAFFVLIVTFSEIDLPRFEAVKAGIAQQLGQRSVVRPASQLRAELMTTVDSLGMADAVRVDTSRRGIEIELAATAFYHPGAAEVRPEARPVVAEIARTLLSPRYNRFSISVEGHTDDDPIATERFPSNWELSAARATNIVRLFVDSRLPAHRLQAVGFGDTRPKVPNRDIAGVAIPENQAINRRIIVRIHR
jgi:chemotaxis protein MotB